MNIDSAKLRRIEDCKGRLKEIIGNDAIMQLARDGICPHYVITNPITRDESIWFIASELNEWLDNNYLRQVENTFCQKHTFIYFDKEVHKAKGTIPNELSKIKDLYELPIENISTPSGIYFLCKRSELKYIGQATNIALRVGTHVNEGIKDFDSVYFITCPMNQLNELETSLIRYFQPELNRTSRVSPKGTDLELINSLLSSTSTN